MTLAPLMDRSRMLVALGPGGVGKTTTAAALALKGAYAGRRSLVCTIDPARRLAASLGLRELGDEPAPVAADRFRAAGLAPTDRLWAMMLDPWATLDRLVLEAAEDPGSAKTLLDHPLYQTMVRDLPGMHEYAALSRLHELSADERWELIVLDTPPTTHALDFLDAPRRLVRALESPAIQWLVRPYLKAGRLSLKLLGGARAYVLRRLARIVGTGLLERIAEFLVLFEEVLQGGRKRIEAVGRFLQSGQVQYVLVTSPTAANVQEAVVLAEQLARRRLTLGAVVMNRVHLLEATQAGPGNIAEALAGQPEIQGLEPVDQLRLLKELTTTHQRFQRLARVDQAQGERLLRRLPAVRHVAMVPLLAEDVFDLGGLQRVADHL